MGMDMKGIVGKDIESGNEKLTLALLSQLMRNDIFNFIKNIKSDGKEITPDFMIEWANKKVSFFLFFFFYL
jgi:hypothetical protein